MHDPTILEDVGSTCWSAWAGRLKLYLKSAVIFFLADAYERVDEFWKVLSTCSFIWAFITLPLVHSYRSEENRTIVQQKLHSITHACTVPNGNVVNVSTYIILIFLVCNKWVNLASWISIYLWKANVINELAYYSGKWRIGCKSLKEIGLD
jgi:hypothetical protein